MPVFKVTVERTERKENVFTVEADGADAAHDIALDEASNHDFGQNTVASADEMVISVVNVTPAVERQ